MNQEIEKIIKQVATNNEAEYVDKDEWKQIHKFKSKKNILTRQLIMIYTNREVSTGNKTTEHMLQVYYRLKNWRAVIKQIKEEITKTYEKENIITIRTPTNENENLQINIQNKKNQVGELKLRISEAEQEQKITIKNHKEPSKGIEAKIKEYNKEKEELEK